MTEPSGMPITNMSVQELIREAEHTDNKLALRLIECFEEATDLEAALADALIRGNENLKESLQGKVGVLTAVRVFHNALIDHIIRNFDLAPKGQTKAEVEPAFIPTCPTSGVDYKMSEEAHDQSVYIDTPNGCISILYDSESQQTVIRGYDGEHEQAGEHEPDWCQALITTPKEKK